MDTSENNLINTDNNIKITFLNKIKSKFILFLILSFLCIITGIILFFTVSSDKTLGGCVIIFGVAVLFFDFIRYSFKNENNIEVIKAKCIDKSRSGYRKEYLEYTFECEDKTTFIIKTAQKGKFKKEIQYYLCFKKGKTIENSTYSGANLLDFSQA